MSARQLNEQAHAAQGPQQMSAPAGCASYILRCILKRCVRQDFRTDQSPAIISTTLLRDVIRRRLLEPILTLLRQGITPQKIALSVAFGLGLGIFPLLGGSTSLCTGVALVLYCASTLRPCSSSTISPRPCSSFLIIPCVRLGKHLVHATPQPLSISGGLRLLAAGIFHAVIVLSSAIVHAALGWALAGPRCIYLAYLLLRPLMMKAARTRGLARAAAPQAP
jgi:hypothetical protein